MAYTKVFAIRKRLNKSIQYVQNSEKTELAAMIQYAENEEKEALVSALNCQIETAYNEMQLTKERWQKTDGVQGYHLIQSFAPGEVEPKEAHAIGVELANILFGEHYEVLIGTHLDQWHLHNHIVVNSVSFTTGEKYHSNRKSYYGEIRKVSDELCKKHALSVINPQNHGKNYAEYTENYRTSEASLPGRAVLAGVRRGSVASACDGAALRTVHGREGEHCLRSAV